MPQLEWSNRGPYEEAVLGTRADGVIFTLVFQPTCYRRGPYKLLIEVCGGGELPPVGLLRRPGPAYAVLPSPRERSE